MTRKHIRRDFYRYLASTGYIFDRPRHIIIKQFLNDYLNPPEEKPEEEIYDSDEHLINEP